MAFKVIFIGLVVFYLHRVSGHGMMLDPPNRASLWRFIPSLEPDYGDNEFFCGGVQIMYGENGGKCGECGDNWASPKPRRNENTGHYGNGIIFRNYDAGSVVNVSVTLTANHLGTMHFSLCKLEDPTKPETEDCFSDLKLADGSDSYAVIITDYIVNVQLKLPEELTCTQCVMRWTYKAGNSWGTCDDGTGAIGCGDQETFRSCADIAIV